jgi:hypothetical protein
MCVTALEHPSLLQSIAKIGCWIFVEKKRFEKLVRYAQK